MQLSLDISKSTFLIAKEPEPSMDTVSGVQRVNRDGQPLFSTQLVMINEAGAEVINVKTATKPIGVSTGTTVRVFGLVAKPWAINDRNGVSFSADRIEAVSK